MRIVLSVFLALVAMATVGCEDYQEWAAAGAAATSPGLNLDLGELESDESGMARFGLDIPEEKTDFDGEKFPMMDELDSCTDPPEGKSSLWCVKSEYTTDADGDGFYRQSIVHSELIEDSEENEWLKCFTCGSGDKCLCPEGYLMSSEKDRCDSNYVPDEILDPEASPDSEYLKLFRSYETTDYPWPYDNRLSRSKNFFRRIKPSQREVPFNGVDDDCDGWVDEAETLYSPGYDDVGPVYKTIRIRVNDMAIKKHASRIRYFVHRLEDVTWNMYTRMRATGETYDTPIIDVVEYNGETRYDLHIYGLEPSTVYVAQVEFGAPGIFSEFAPILCFNDQGHPAIEGYISPWEEPCQPDAVWDDFYKEYKHRNDMPHIDLHFFMTRADPDAGEIKRRRTKIVNQAIYEWSLAENGLVGNQRKYNIVSVIPWEIEYLFPEPYSILGEAPFYTNRPLGTRYTADYGEKWCSEFASWIFVKHLSKWTVVRTYVKSMRSKFKWGTGGEWYQDGGARNRIKNGTAKPGDYLSLFTRKSTDKDDKYGNHSAIFLAYPEGEDDGNVWYVNGSSERKVMIVGWHTRKAETCDDSSCKKRFKGLGIHD